MKIITSMTIILVLMTVLSGCSGKKKNDNNAVSEGNNRTEISEENNNENFGGRGDRIQKVEISDIEKKTVKKVQNLINTEENMINRYFLLSELSGRNNINPEDFEIGSLYSGEKEYVKAVSMIEDFFRELKLKKIKTDIIAEESRFYLGKIFEEYIKNNNLPEKIRIGTPFAEGDLISVNLRFIKNSGKTEGEVVIIKRKEGLFIKGFKGDLSLIESNNEKTIFEPEIYHFN